MNYPLANLLANGPPEAQDLWDRTPILSQVDRIGILSHSLAASGTGRPRHTYCPLFADLLHILMEGTVGIAEACPLLRR
jgi:hypothetical protein